MADDRSSGQTETVDTHLVEEAPVIEESLIEEVSIDGMCGVY